VNDPFFESKREWSHWKHLLLKSYLPKFAGIIGSRHPIIYCVDGFAGAGRYLDPPEDGSPVISANLAQEIAARGRGYSLKCINVEPLNFDELVAATSTFDPALVDNRKGLLSDHIDDILKTIGTHPAFFFLDPYGPKPLEWALVARLAERSQSGAKTEILANFHVPKIDRDAGWIDSPPQPGRDAFVANTNGVFGGSEWQPIITPTLNKAERIEKLTALYEGKVTAVFGCKSGHYAVRTLDGATKYMLVHGTGNKRGRREMSDCVFRVSMKYDEAAIIAAQKAALAARQSFLFMPEKPSENEIDAGIAQGLALDIAVLLNASSPPVPLTIEQMEDLLQTGAWFGRAIEKHYRAACHTLVAQDKVTVLGQPKPKKPGARIAIPADAKILWKDR
jgi:three-Cys-motif partner protein